MLSEPQLLQLLSDLESHRIERTTATTDTSKFGEAICAFANDLARSGQPGYLLIGVDDRTGKPSGLTVTDQLLQNLAGIASDGNILPAPVMVAYKVTLSSGLGDVAVVEVQPSDIPPVRFKGKVWVRRGPRKGIANETDERFLSEQRIANHLSFDASPCLASAISDLSLELFTVGYRPFAIDPQVIEENERPITVQLASLRFYDLLRRCPTNAGILLFGKNPLYHLPTAFVQYVCYAGDDLGSDIMAERQFSGDLLSLLRDLDRMASELPAAQPVILTTLRESMVYNYPPVALREIFMNAVLHRAYDQPSPIRILQFASRIEVSSPGSLFGLATPENFPRQTSYRNPVIAEAMKVLGFVNRYGRGIGRARSALSSNGNPPAEFEFGDTFFGATVERRS